MLVAAIIMLVLCQVRGEHPFKVWHDRFALVKLVAYAFLGLVPVQFCYFKTVEYGALSVTGWGMLIAGGTLNLYQPFWQQKVTVTPINLGLLLITILVGTVIAFLLYSTSLLYILPTTATLLDAFEPLSATFFAVLLVHTHLQRMDFIGGAIIILAVVIITTNIPNLLVKKAPAEQQTKTN